MNSAIKSVPLVKGKAKMADLDRRVLKARSRSSILCAFTAFEQLWQAF
jgi:hypothetical protein